ncbi:hypothetical protein [Gemmatimonas groenlandica]|uniref:Periplasmic heavy metal sensor n=1 Tax=Gemmatimonas groenlandica TaxID=2732249 RepID=A0A6M4IIY5_9BACT|nr:hypothetical protein [Gemmatimonas groenlandica]QJR34005.1 hypothetical protein HKW67_15450 [Gemmatimonas groenlandica]
MKMDLRSTTIVGGTLALGIVLGLVLQGTLQRRRNDRMGQLRHEQGFVRHMESIIQPRADQRAVIMPLLEKTGARNSQIIGAAQAELRSTLEAMRAQLEPVLDADQRRRMNEMGRLPDPFRPPPGGGPPGGGPPGGETSRGGPPGGGPPPSPER